jgi:hypothetical protein
VIPLEVIEGANNTDDDPIRLCTPLFHEEPMSAGVCTGRAVYSTYNPCARVIYR